MDKLKKLMANEINKVDLKDHDRYNLLTLKLKYFNELFNFYEYVRSELNLKISDEYQRKVLEYKINKLEEL
jgi:hypothetical protein